MTRWRGCRSHEPVAGDVLRSCATLQFFVRLTLTHVCRCGRGIVALRISCSGGVRRLQSSGPGIAGTTGQRLVQGVLTGLLYCRGEAVT